MQENQDNRSVNNDEIEIDLVELFGELKKNWKLIVGTTVAFAAAAAIYSFCIAKPVYQYNAMIRIPANIINHEFTVNTCLELLTNDGVASVKNARRTSLISLSFDAYSPADAKAVAEAYLPKALEKVNHIIKGADGVVVDKDVVGSNQEAVMPVKVNSSFAKDAEAELILQNKQLDIPVSPNKKKNIAVATLLGLFVSCGYTIGKFLWKK